tara:strand:+ start:985 stop:2559 length:1575 start_codon:yes stop_codon:yes gene_type:complete
MATVDLGKISFTQKGTYAAGTTYAVKDVVQHTDQNETSSFVKINSSASGEAPQTNGTINTSHWAIFAKGSSLATSNLATYDAGTTYKKGDIVQYTDTGVISTYLYINNTPASGLTPSSGGAVDVSHWQFVAKGTASVAVAWQSTAKTADFTAAASEGYFVDTNGGSFTVTTPSSPNAGDEFVITDLRGTFATNKLSVDGNGSDKIKGSTKTFELNKAYGSIRLVYSGATYGWIPVSSNITDGQPISFSYTADYLVVGGGGGGGNSSNDSPTNNSSGGGGGAGGFRTATGVSLVGGAVYTIVVGQGGAGGAINATASSGTASSITGSGLTISAAGGGGGGGEGNNGADGGSGGGGGYGNDAPPGTAGAGNTPSTSPSQGFPGQAANSPANFAGGGGGAGEAGGTDANGQGGDGVSNSITGSAVDYAGGGGAGVQSGSPAQPGGTGGGGDGSAGAGSPGTANTGGGGSGSGNSPPAAKVGGTGGSGVVILRILTSDYTGTVTGSPTVTTDGSHKVVKFTASGTYTA